MPQITLPDVKMPDVNMPDMKMPDVKMPDALRDLEMPKFDMSKVELPKQITDRMPNRNRRNPIRPIAAVVAVGGIVVAAWWLITSPFTGPRIRKTVKHLRSLMTDPAIEKIELEDQADLGSLLGDAPDAARSSIASDPYAKSNGVADLEAAVAVEADQVRETVHSN